MLFFEDDDCVAIVLDGLIVAAQHELGVGLAEVVLDHVVITELQRLADVLQ